MPESIEKYKLLMMKKIDGEISPAEAADLARFVEANPDYASELKTFEHLKQETQEMKASILPELAWDDYWKQLYNRLERSISWIMISAGAVILLSFGLYEMILNIWNDADMPLMLKVGILSLVIGTAILLVSVIREKIFLRKHDKYKEVQR